MSSEEVGPARGPGHLSRAHGLGRWFQAKATRPAPPARARKSEKHARPAPDSLATPHPERGRHNEISVPVVVLTPLAPVHPGVEGFLELALIPGSLG